MRPSGPSKRTQSAFHIHTVHTSGIHQVYIDKSETRAEVGRCWRREGCGLDGVVPCQHRLRRETVIGPPTPVFAPAKHLPLSRPLAIEYLGAARIALSLSSAPLSVFLLPRRESRFLSAMAIQKEPGQKGVSWSNIAVGEYTRVGGL